MAISKMIGAKIHRREDPRLVSGAGRFVDDLKRPGTVHVIFGRSPYPHARVGSIDTAAALRAPGVLAVLTAADFDGVLAGSAPVAPALVAGEKTVPGRP